MLLKITFNLYFISLFHYLDLFSPFIIKLYSMTCLCNDFFLLGILSWKNEIQCDKQSFSRERCERTWDVVYVFIVRVRSTKKCFCNAWTMVWRGKYSCIRLGILSILKVYLFHPRIAHKVKVLYLNFCNVYLVNKKELVCCSIGKFLISRENLIGIYYEVLHYDQFPDSCQASVLF